MKRGALILLLLAGTGLAGVFGGGGKETKALQSRVDELSAERTRQNEEMRTLTQERDRLNAERSTLSEEVLRLSKTPITAEIIQQIRDPALFRELDYFISIPLVLIRANFDEAVALESGTLTFTETTRSTQTAIGPGDAGRLQIYSPAGAVRPAYDAAGEGGTFEISFLPEGVVLGFIMNRSRNCYDLEYIRVDSQTVPLRFSGARPHLLIRYQAEFLGDTKIQVVVPAGGISLETPHGAAPPEAAGAVAAWASPGSTAAYRNSAVEDEGSEENRGGGTLPAGQESPAPTFSQAEEDARIAELRRQLEVLDSTSRTPGEPLRQERDPSYDPATPLFSTGSGAWVVQVGAFAENENAENAAEILRDAGFRADRDHYGGFTRVFIRGVEDSDVENISFIIELLGFGEPYIRKQ